MSRNEGDYFILRNGDFFVVTGAGTNFAVRDELGCHATKETILRIGDFFVVTGAGTNCCGSR